MKNKILFIILALSIPLLGYYLYQRNQLINAGYCFEQKRYLDEQELIDEAIRDAIIDYKPSQIHIISNPNIGSVPSNSRYDQYYQSVDDFKQSNPDCCRILPRAETRDEEIDYINNIAFEFKISRLFSDRFTTRDYVELNFAHGEYENRSRDESLAIQGKPASWNVVMKKQKHLYLLTNCGRISSID